MEELRLAVRHHLQLNGKELVFRLGRLQSLDDSHHWGQSVTLPALSVHGQFIQVTEFLLNRTIWISVLLKLFQNTVDALVVVLSQAVEAAITRIGRGQRIGLHPPATGILIEVIGRTYAGVEVFQMNTRFQLCVSRDCH